MTAEQQKVVVRVLQAQIAMTPSARRVPSTAGTAGGDEIEDVGRQGVGHR